MPIAEEIFVYTILLIGGVWSYATCKLTLAGALTGAFIGFIIFKGAGFACFLMLTVFFIIGSAATKWQRNKKTLMNAADTHKGRRTAAQVLANGGTAALLSLLAWFKPDHVALLQLMIAGSIAAATADTLSSELGTVYGRRFYNILTLKKDTRGLDGVISFEGTLIGIAGAFIIAVLYALFFGWSSFILYIVVAGFVGNLFDSILGATLERRGLIGNNTVNFLNTVMGALACLALWNFI